MGIVYHAVDERLHRDVALKMIRQGATDDHARARLWREARAAASLNHPNVCQLYEIAEEDGELFLTMELLEGGPLSQRLVDGPLACAEAVRLSLSVLTALGALHKRGLVHRDLKPSNVFLTPHGVKLLDFGLARSMPTAVDATATNLTRAGGPIGTPNYMAPEQVLGQPVDGRTDLFAAGSMLYEMLCGRPPFGADSVVRIFHSIIADDPPALGGSPAVVAADRVIRRALAKNPDARYQTADAMSHDLRTALLAPDSGTAGAARSMTRLIALPLRVLRPDPETDFLAFSVPDAITNSLSGLDSLIVRSSLAASRFTGLDVDVKAIAAEAGVDVVLSGTLLRAGDQLSVSTQLVAAPDGAVVWSQTSRLALGDLFRLQDNLSSRIVESLALRLTEREHRLLKRDVPATPRAYECYLRANQLLLKYSLSPARDLYLQCLEEDPAYAPAWARLGAAYRMLGKFSDTQSRELLQQSEEAFRRALDINPDLSMAHNQQARLLIDMGRAHEAMIALLARARIRTSDAELFAALVQACRYCGLLDASVAAHDLARRLDRHARTSVVHTYIMSGDLRRALEATAEEPADVITLVIILFMLDRLDDASAALEHETYDVPMPLRWMASLRLMAQGRRQEALHMTQGLLLASHQDPETAFYVARQLASLGDTGEALTMLERAVAGGFWCPSMMVRDPWLDALRSDPRFATVLREADIRSRASRAAFLEADGDRLLGLQPEWA